MERAPSVATTAGGCSPIAGHSGGVGGVLRLAGGAEGAHRPANRTGERPAEKAAVTSGLGLMTRRGR